MSWTYDATQLGTSNLYQVRFVIGDTDNNEQLLQDEEIDFLLTENGSVSAAAVACCENLSAKFARLVDHSLGPYSVRASQKAVHFNALAKQISKQTIKYSVPSMSSEQHTSIFDIDMNNYGIDDHEGGNS